MTVWRVVLALVLAWGLVILSYFVRSPWRILFSTTALLIAFAIFFVLLFAWRRVPHG